MSSTWKNGWLIAEPVVLLTGFFTFLVWLSILNSPIYTLLLLSFFFPMIPSMAAISLAIWKYRNRVSNKALVGSVALGCYSWLQIALPIIGFGFGGIRILVLVSLSMGSIYWIAASADRKPLVKN